MALEQTGLEFIAEGAEAFDQALDTAAESVSSFEGTASQAADSFNPFEEIITGALRRVGEVALDFAVNVGQALIQFGKDSFEGALEAEKGLVRLRGAIKRAGDNAAISEEDALAYAESLKGLAGGSDDAVIAAQAMLLKFQDIGKDVFPQALQTSLDLAAVLGTDAVSAAEQLGRALGNPEAASRLLKQAGVFLTDQEKEQITAFIEAGDAASAQSFILEKLATTTAGAAAEMAGTVGGQMAIFKESIADAGEQIAMAFLPLLQTLMDQYLKPLLPIIESLAKVIAAQIAPGFGQLQTIITDLLPVFQPLVDAFEQLRVVFVDDFPEMKKSAEELVVFIKEQLGIVGPQAIGDLASSIETLADLWDKHGQTIMDVTKFVFKIVIATIGGAMVLITGIIEAGLRLIAGGFDFYSALFEGRWSDAFEIMLKNTEDILAIIGDTIKSFFNVALSVVGTNWDQFIAQWTNNMHMLGMIIGIGFTNIVNEIKSWAFGIFDAFLNVFNQVTDMLRNFSSIFWGIGWAVVEGIAQGIRNGAFTITGALWDVVNSAINNVRSMFGIHSPSDETAKAVGRPLAEGVAMGFTDMIAEMSGAFGKSLDSSIQMIAPPAMNGIGASSNVAYNNSNNWNLNVNSSQNSQGIISDFAIMESWA